MKLLAPECCGCICLEERIKAKKHLQFYRWPKLALCCDASNIIRKISGFLGL
jgi:hypothetical protein